MNNDFKDLYKYLVNDKKENQLYTGIVSSLDPLQVKLYPGDDAINVKAKLNCLQHIVLVLVIVTRKHRICTCIALFI